MAARSIGTATVSFGLVSIPVKLYSATQAQSAISFNLLHNKCGGRLKQQYICPRDNNELVERDQMVKGYEFAKDKYVTFTPEELKSLEEKATQTIEIAEFVPSAKIDPVYFDKAYYLGPDKGGDRAYRLLSEVMLQSGRTALARYAARGKQYLVQLRPVPGGGIVLQQLLYADEIRPFADVDLATVDVKEQELKLATAIVDQIAHDEFKPEQYKDDVKTRVQEQIQRKIEGQEIQSGPSEAPSTQIIDLMEALKASLASREQKPAAKAHAEPKHEAPDAHVEKAAPQKPKLAAVPDPEPVSERKPAKRAPREKSEKAEKKAAKK
ncbi:MAG: Ku protein [Deltaproteobacteria bacterium]|nr:Ku protein [Deltaproteobacteria bacterium]